MVLEKKIQVFTMQIETICPFELGLSWQRALEEELKKPYVLELAAFVERERALGKEVYPPKELVFNAFKQTSYKDARVVIVGQDPYHGPGQAHGLSFSVPKGVPPPPSLKNVFKELADDVGISAPKHGCLLKWAKQGVMLLNATLTVLRGQPMSHHRHGWEKFTDAVIAKLCERKDPLIFVLWGKSAQEKCEHLPEFAANLQHLILKAPHPSPFSARSGFFGCQHFSKINTFLTEHSSPPIDWQI